MVEQEVRVLAQALMELLLLEAVVGAAAILPVLAVMLLEALEAAVKGEKLGVALEQVLSTLVEAEAELEIQVLLVQMVGRVL